MTRITSYRKNNMWIRRKHLSRLAILTICGCASVNLYLLQREAWRSPHIQDKKACMNKFLRYKPLGPLLPKGEVTCFLFDGRLTNLSKKDRGRMFYLAQSAVSPRLIGIPKDFRWVVIDSGCPEDVPKIAAASHWTLQADLRNGVRLYRTNVKE